MQFFFIIIIVTENSIVGSIILNIVHYMFYDIFFTLIAFNFPT